MAKSYWAKVKTLDNIERIVDLQFVSIAGHPEGVPKNNNAAISKATAYVAAHNASLLPHELPTILIAVLQANVETKTIWSKFTA